MIKLKDVNKVYEDGFHALKNLNIEFEEGKINVLIGPSGCGKTTTMKLVNKLIEYTDGSITIDGKDINEMDTIDLRRQTGYVIQNIGLFPHMNIYDNVATVPKLLKWEKAKINERVDELLELVNLDPKQYKYRYPSELSGGQQQRIGVIRALAAEPATILMDEPFSALDPISREQLQDELIHLQETIQKTIIFVTHDMDEAIKIADRIILMEAGEVVQEGTPAELLSNPKNDFVREFIGTERLNKNSPLPRLRELMQIDFLSAHESDHNQVAVEKMVEHKLSYLPVTDKAGTYVGMVSLYDAIQMKTEQVKTIVDRERLACTETESLEKVWQKIDDTDELSIPVVNEQGKLVGLLPKHAVIKTVRKVYEH